MNLKSSMLIGLFFLASSCSIFINGGAEKAYIPFVKKLGKKMTVIRFITDFPSCHKYALRPDESTENEFFLDYRFNLYQSSDNSILYLRDKEGENTYEIVNLNLMEKDVFILPNSDSITVLKIDFIKGRKRIIFKEPFFIGDSLLNVTFMEGEGANTGFYTFLPGSVAIPEVHVNYVNK